MCWDNRQQACQVSAWPLYPLYRGWQPVLLHYNWEYFPARDPARFIKSTAITEEGEVAGKNIYALDLDRISEEEKYDGFYAVITNLEGDVGEILKINRQRWEIEENFRITKTDFEARPVYVRREDRIKAHFLTCYISLLI